ncbi:hypothetical protein T484DRAFT_1763057, partial [Baffinella frigidus]
EVAIFVGKGGSFALVDASQLLTRMSSLEVATFVGKGGSFALVEASVVATFVGKGGSFALVDASQLLTRMSSLEVATFVGKGGSFALVDASQLLTRMTLEGVSVGARWAPVVDLWFEHVHDHRLAFNDVHISLAADDDDDSARYVRA